VAVGDLNRDGRPDLVVGEHFSTALQDHPTAVHLYLNEGNDDAGNPRFRDVTEKSGIVPFRTKAPHVEIVDLDQDGWPDILTSASADDGRVPAVFRNRGPDADGVPHFDVP